MNKITKEYNQATKYFSKWLAGNDNFVITFLLFPYSANIVLVNIVPPSKSNQAYNSIWNTGSSEVLIIYIKKLPPITITPTNTTIDIRYLA